MKHYAVYDRASGALIAVGRTIPDPLPETQAVKTYPGPTPHSSFWDPSAREFLIPLDLPEQVRGRIQSLTDPAGLGLFATKLAAKHGLDAQRLTSAILRAHQGRITLEDYELLKRLPALGLETI